ncbi:hypothetical protein L1D40_19570, partial [Shewanella insulae]|uniref:hypothetical protein n=1 Tax=Shewanella insulae TaxID=2681496 RepID=UPI001EFE307E
LAILFSASLHEDLLYIEDCIKYVFCVMFLLRSGAVPIKHHIHRPECQQNNKEKGDKTYVRK